MSKFFTLKQAELLIPELESAIREAVALKSDYETAESEVQGTSRRIMMAGGDHVNLNHVAEVKARRDTAVGRLKQAMEGITGNGCLIKDLDIGLIDFPTLLR